jgi:hypothetical protein
VFLHAIIAANVLIIRKSEIKSLYIAIFRAHIAKVQDPYINVAVSVTFSFLLASTSGPMSSLWFSTA